MAFELSQAGPTFRHHTVSRQNPAELDSVGSKVGNSSGDITNTLSVGDEAIKDAARDFTKTFISQSLKDAGFDKVMLNGLGSAGGAFGTFLLDAYAERIVQGGGFGLQSVLEAEFLKIQATENKTDAK